VKYVTEEVHVYRYRWAVLLVFGLIFMIGQAMWLTFSLIREEVTPVLGLAPGDPTIVLLTASQPLAFIILSLPVGVLADRKGLIVVAGFGAILQTLFGALRIIVINDFWMILICQLGLSSGSVMVQDCITYLSVKWFPRNERAVATGFSTLFMLLGMLVGTTLSLLLWTAPMYGNPSYTVGLAQANVESILYIYTILAVLLTVLFFAVARDKPAHPPEIPETVTEKRPVTTMLKDRNVWIISYGFFVGFSIFIGLTGILEELLPSLGIPVTAGFGNLAMVEIFLLIFGLFGALGLSGLSDHVQKRRPFLVVSTFVGAIMTFIVGTSTNVAVTFIAAGALGFFLVSIMPIALSTLEEFKSVGPQLSGASAGLAFWFGNLGAFLGLLILEALRVGGSYFYSILYLVITLLIGAVLIATIPETGKREKS
jgi:nitrate/nitrite transporter NarK